MPHKILVARAVPIVVIVGASRMVKGVVYHRFPFMVVVLLQPQEEGKGNKENKEEQQQENDLVLLLQGWRQPQMRVLAQGR